MRAQFLAYSTIAVALAVAFTALGLSAVLLVVLLLIPCRLYLEWSLLRPLRVMIAADEAIIAGRPEEGLIPPHAIPSHELGEVMRIRNRMLAQMAADHEELKSHIYAISHDLRSPLLSIWGISRLLVKEYQPALGEDGRHYLDRIRVNAQQMEDLVESLLELPRSGGMSPTFTRESPLQILEWVQEELSYPLEWEKVRLVIHQDLPLIYCDRKGIRQVFTNLIRNAVSAMKGVPDPIIEVGHINGDSHFHFYVRDNGMGIDPIQHQRIFEPFHSLFRPEGEETRETSKGLGLAIVQKIVHAHGGEIWVESEPGKGASFHFTLPKPLDP